MFRALLTRDDRLETRVTQALRSLILVRLILEEKENRGASAVACDYVQIDGVVRNFAPEQVECGGIQGCLRNQR